MLVRARSRILLGLVLLASLALSGSAPSGATASDRPIQPGAVIYIPSVQCTMNFIFADGAGQRYVGTAGHCAGLGARVEARSDSGSRFEFGTVVWREHSSTTDFALIQIDTNRDNAAFVNPAMRFWGGPIGVAPAATTDAGDLVLLHGFGIGFGTLEQTRSRPGILVGDNSRRYAADAPAIFGDSGGPVLHYGADGNGDALGIVSALSAPSTLVGPTVEWVLARLAAAGWNIQLVTAPFAFE